MPHQYYIHKVRKQMHTSQFATCVFILFCSDRTETLSFFPPRARASIFVFCMRIVMAVFLRFSVGRLRVIGKTLVRVMTVNIGTSKKITGANICPTFSQFDMRRII